MNDKSSEPMVKMTNRRIKLGIDWVIKKGETVDDVANTFKVSTRRIEQLMKYFNDNGKYPARTSVAVDADVVNLSFDWKIKGVLNYNCQGMAVSMERSPGDPIVSVWPDFCNPWNGLNMMKLGLNIPDAGFSNYITMSTDNEWHNVRLTIYHGMYTLYHNGKPVIVGFGPERVNSSFISTGGWTHSGAPGSGWDNFKVMAAPVDSNINGWYNKDVLVKFLAFDATSGLKTVTPDTWIRSEGASQSRPGEATDNAGMAVPIKEHACHFFSFSDHGLVC